MRPVFYRLATRAAALALGLFSRKSGRFRHLPLAGNWTDTRDFPAPEGDTFMALYAKSRRE
jgi:L-lactate dehydrogenase complex protein LldF